MNSTSENAVVREQRWLSYVATSTAGALSFLTPHSQLAADVTFIELNQFLLDREPGDREWDTFVPYTFGGTGALFYMLQGYVESLDIGAMAIQGAGDISFIGFRSDFCYVSNIPYGQPVALGAGGRFAVPAGEIGQMARAADNFSIFQFQDPGLGFVGFRFDVGEGTQYGFVEVIMDGGPVHSGVIVGYGWADHGETIFACQRPNIPEPSALGVLALGSIGVMAWRRKKLLAARKV